MKFWQITIDGPAASGKSVVGKWLANTLNAKFIDTGLHYRAFALWCIQHKMTDNVIHAAKKALVNFEVDIADDDSLIMNGMRVSNQELQVASVTKLASIIASLPDVRQKLTQLQRQAALQQNSVVVGRDVGSVILPSAICKIFLTASAAKRAERRHLQNQANHIASNLLQIQQNIMVRDEQDRNRAIAPLKVPLGAQVIDNSLLTISETQARLLNLAKLQISKEGLQW